MNSFLRAPRLKLPIHFRGRSDGQLSSFSPNASRAGDSRGLKLLKFLEAETIELRGSAYPGRIQLLQIPVGEIGRGVLRGLFQ